MPHSIEIKAKQVLSNSSNYPEVVVTRALEIVVCFAKKRQAIQDLWSHRELWRRWFRAKHSSGAKSLLLRERAATAQLKREGFCGEDLNVLYIGHHLLGKSPVSPIVAAEFKAGCQLVECTDLTLVHRYLACVNARRHDTTVAPVGFIRWCGTGVVSEILAWKLLRSAEQATTQPKSPLTKKRIDELVDDGLFVSNPYEIVRKIEEEHDIFKVNCI